MSDLLAQVKNLYDSAKSAPAKIQANFTIFKEGKKSFLEDQHYIQILINEMYLSKERQWWVRYAPVALVATTLQYGKEYKTIPTVVGPALFQQLSKDVYNGTVIHNEPVTHLRPYLGGSITLTVLFSKVENVDNSDKVLNVLENFANVASPIAPTIPFSSYLKLASGVVEGMRILFNLPKTQTIFAYRDTINPQVEQSFESAHLVLIDTPNLSDNEKKEFWVKNKQLYHGDNESSAEPYRKNDFILLEIAQGDKRTDEETLSFYPLWEQTRKLALQSALQDGFWGEAKRSFNALKVAIYESPDLTVPDIKRLTKHYLDEMKEIREGKAEEQDLKIEKQSPDMLEEYQQIAKQLDELDKL